MSMPTPAQIQYMKEHIADDKRPDLIAAFTVSISLAYIAVILRFVARRRRRVQLLADDWLMLVALILVTGFVTASFCMVRYGLGRHVILVTDAVALVKVVVAAEVLYCASIVPIKISILYLYHRIFPSPNMRTAAIVVGATVVAYSVTQAVAMILQCIPLSSLWTGAPGRCIDIATLFTVMAVLNVLTDFIMLVMPVPFLWRLKVSRARKIQIFCIFALGGCVCIFAIIRSTYVGTASPNDVSWSDIDGATWSVIEVCVGVVSACLPTLRPLFQRGGQDTRSAPSKGASDYDGYSLPLSNKPKQGWTTVSTATVGVHDDTRPFARLDETSNVAGDRQSAKPFSRPSNQGIAVTTELHQQYHTKH